MTVQDTHVEGRTRHVAWRNQDSKQVFATHATRQIRQTWFPPQIRRLHSLDIIGPNPWHGDFLCVKVLFLNLAASLRSSSL